jgi:hypothetical protein
MALAGLSIALFFFIEGLPSLPSLLFGRAEDVPLLDRYQRLLLIRIWQGKY